jgi:hypothetical protein
MEIEFGTQINVVSPIPSLFYTLETSGRTKFVPVPLLHAKSAIPHVGAEAVRYEVPSFCTSFPVKPFGGRPQRLNEVYISAVNVFPVTVLHAC